MNEKKTLREKIYLYNGLLAIKRLVKKRERTMANGGPSERDFDAEKQ